ncbi:apicoplast ribosomal protein L27 precursor, putative [Hepatocystis sp. ex Piliocolobus tephrosceles]|nr:apicoplast ribosomal protein L27 precursor, putative [Hepatocystis sp. ex Piliocolobus tephrosceles]
MHFLFVLFFFFIHITCTKEKHTINPLEKSCLKYLNKKPKHISYFRSKLMYISKYELQSQKKIKHIPYNMKHNLFKVKNYLNLFFIKEYNVKVSIIRLNRLNKLWAKKKGAGSTKNGRDSNPKNLGVKVLGNNYAHAGNIIVRQRGRTFKPGYGVKQGRDFTLVATKPGKVHFFNRVVSIIDVSDPKPLTFQDIYRQDPTILSLSKRWTSAV